MILAASLVISQTAYCFNDALDGYYGNNIGFYDSGFADIQGHWAKEEIEHLAKYGIVSGVDGNFYPDEAITRAQFIKILILAFGLYDKNATCFFSDVPKESWYYPYVASAKHLSLASGINNNEFGADKLLERQDMAVLIYNTALYCGLSFGQKTEISFADKNEIESYAIDAVTALGNGGIISGDEQKRFKPKGKATRAQVCKILYGIEGLLKI